MRWIRETSADKGSECTAEGVPHQRGEVIQSRSVEMGIPSEKCTADDSVGYKRRGATMCTEWVDEACSDRCDVSAECRIESVDNGKNPNNSRSSAEEA